jgi:hypothetical protein
MPVRSQNKSLSENWILTAEVTREADGDRVQTSDFLVPIEYTQPTREQAAEREADADHGVEEQRLRQVLVQAVLHFRAENGGEGGEGKEEGDEQVEPVGLHRHLMGAGGLLFGFFGDGEFQGVADIVVKQLRRPLDVLGFVPQVDEVPIRGQEFAGLLQRGVEVSRGALNRPQQSESYRVCRDTVKDSGYGSSKAWKSTVTSCLQNLSSTRISF